MKKTKAPASKGTTDESKTQAPAACECTPWYKCRRLWLTLAAIAILAVIAAAFVPEAFEGKVLMQGDTRQGVANGQETVEYMQQTGEKSWWTNSLFSGMPTFQISPSFSSNSLFSWINTVMGLGLPSPANLIFMMMVGMLILLLAMRMRWGVALLGAVAYGFSSYFIIIIGAGHIWKFVTLAYIPPTIAGIVLCYRGRYLAGAALAALFTMMQVASNHVQMTYYFLFVVLGFMIAYLCMAIKERTLKRFGIATGALAVAALLGVMANLPSLYNTYEYSKLTMRGNHSELTAPGGSGANSTSGLDRDYITQYSYEISETWTLLIPDVKGGSSMHSLGELDAAKGGYDGNVQEFLNYVPQYFGGPEGTSGPVYVGALIFALFLLGCLIVKGPMKWVLVVLTLFSIILAWGRNAMIFTDWMIDYMPMYSKFRTVESILVIAEFTIPLLAVMALQQLVSAPDRAKKYAHALYISFGLTLLVCAVAIFIPSMFGDVVSDQEYAMLNAMQQQYLEAGYPAAQVQPFIMQITAAIESLRYSMIESDGLRSFFIVALGFGCIFLYMRGKLNSAAVVACVAVVCVADLFLVNRRYLGESDFHKASEAVNAGIKATPADQYILADTTQNYRVMYTHPNMFQSPVPSYFHKTIGGYHAAKLTRYQDLINTNLIKFCQDTIQTDADWNVLNMLNARYVVDATGVPHLNPEAMGNAWIVDTLTYVKGADAEMAALQTINPATHAVADELFREILGNATPKAPGDTIYETSYAPNRLTYHTRSARGGVAVMSEIFFPWGWKAKIDGKEVTAPGRVNYVLRAMPIPAGEHEIELVFDPDSVHTTVSVATVAVILIYVLCAAAIVVGVVRRRKCAAAKQ